MHSRLYEIPEQCDFSTVWNNTANANECSPKLTPEFFNPFQGILINTPITVELDGNLDLKDFIVTPAGHREGPLRIMLAGSLQVPVGTLNKDCGLNEKVLIVAINQKTAETFSGYMSLFGFKVDPIEIPLPEGETEEDIAKGDVRELFNVDLIENLKLPIMTADYTVYAVLGEYKSNVREVKVRVKK